jgi:hypothetical protein
MADPPVWVLCPGKEVLMVSILRRVLTDVFPGMVKKRSWAHASGVSRCLTGESQVHRGGHWAGTVAGRVVKQKAVDIPVNADDPQEKKFGDHLFKGLFENRGRLGIHFLVWDEQTTLNGRVQQFPTRPMTDAQKKAMTPWGLKSHLHRDHIHIEFDRARGDQDHSRDLREVLTQIRSAVGPV